MHFQGKWFIFFFNNEAPKSESVNCRENTKCMDYKMQYWLGSNAYYRPSLESPEMCCGRLFRKYIGHVLENAFRETSVKSFSFYCNL